jgi:2-dehydro-3-deoxyglucarate aldolase/4-hydroxy-2-oxoheptanedioate aldolase
MQLNKTREKLAKGGAVFGCALQAYRSAEVARTFAAAGFDYIFIDMEHSPFDLQFVQDVIQASVASGITPIVRACELLYSLTARLLDAGAQGIILPRVEDPKLLEEALSWLRFPPLGKRGFGINPSMIGYEAHPFSEIMAHHNEQTLSVVQFESQVALDRADELLSLKGFDIAMVGPADLSISLGVPGHLDSPKLISAIDGLIEKCRKHNVVPGIQTRGAAMAKFWAERGMRFVGSGADYGLLLEKGREAVATLQAAVAK